MQTKRMLAAVIAVIMVFSTCMVSAEWLFAGYDTRDENNFGKIYNEVIDGAYTGNVKIDPVPLKAVTWKAEGFEKAWPHAGYDRLYLEGKAQPVTEYNNTFAQWETRFADYFWELNGDHMIYQRQQTKIPGAGWTWDMSDDEAIDARLCVRTNREADVKESFKIFGVGPYDLNGKIIEDKEILAMYDRFGVNNKIFDIIPDTEKDIVDGSFFSEENLSRKDEKGQFIVTDEVIAEYAGSIVTKMLEGPSFRGESGKKDVAAIYMALEDPEVWEWDWDTVKYGGAQIAWTAPTFEMNEPYDMYQYLIINGLVFDGREDLPRIYRYTGGVASPKVEWKYIFAEKPEYIGFDSAAVYPDNFGPVIEVKYVNGKLALDENGEPIYRIPTGQYGKVYVKVTDEKVSFWLKDAKGDVEIYSEPRYDTYGGYYGYAAAGNIVAY